MGSAIDRVLVASADGRTGREVLRVLQSTDLSVRGMIQDERRTATTLDRGADEVIVGDLFSSADASRAVRNCDAVLCAVGSRLVFPTLAWRPVDGAGVQNLIHAAVAADVERFVYESAIGVGDSAGGRNPIVRLGAMPLLRAKNDSEAELRTVGPPYTIVRPGRLTDAPATREVLIGEGGATVHGSIPRADVARLLVASLFTPESRNRTFEVVSRRGMRGTARGLVDLNWQFPDEQIEE